MKTNYLAITIGPLYKTMIQARSTREIWASSFIFSLLMKEILTQLKGNPKVETILNPTVTSISSTGTYHGAGIYPDRCHLQMKEALTDDEIDALRKKALDALPFWSYEQKERYFQIYVIQTQFEASATKSVLEHLNQVLDSTELQQKFIQQGSMDIIGSLDSNIQKLYKSGVSENDGIFKRDSGDRRLPSIIEIINQEHEHFSNYAEIVTQRIWTQLRQSRKTKKYWDETDGDILSEIKKKIAKESFKTRNKYFAIVQADGDGIGSMIQALGNEAASLADFSEKLFDFSKIAAKHIFDFGALPVYIGGDDLLFVAPLVNKKDQTLFELIDTLDGAFAAKIDEEASMSYGISIGYYKYPMGEVMTNAYELLSHSAKQLKIGKRAKNAAAFLVRKHSGQTFGTILPKGSEAYEYFTEMLKKHHNNLKESFLSSLIYTLKAHEFLLVQALKEGREEHFFKHHFNEGVHTTNRQYLDSVRDLSRLIYDDMNGVEANNGWVAFGKPKDKDEIVSTTIYSCLRLIQFLNAKDHD